MIFPGNPTETAAFIGKLLFHCFHISCGKVGFVHELDADNPFPRAITRARVAQNFPAED